ncbi:MAG TPA: xanthine dehydrogenase family protein subunit M [Chloroflexi bacterium]|nr:xanthine dehydrogenase family protein subunit M [Chloroflexota bacterium]
MNLWNRYYTPHTVEEAFSLLKTHDGAARVVAGGTDLLLEIRQGHRPPVEALVDITRIPELTRITQEGDLVIIGAGVTHTQIIRSELLARRATCLVESCGVIGGPQVRNVGTLGGNVAHALPAADGATSLVALDAEAEILQDGQRRWLPLLELYKGPGKSLLDPTHDLLLHLRFRLCGEGEATAFTRIMRPQGVALPVLGCALWVRMGDDGETIEDARVCIGPVAPVPTRATGVEEELRGRPFTGELLEQAIARAQAELHPRTSKYRATAEYRAEMIGVVLRRALPLAVRRAQTGEATPEGVGLQ